MKAFSYSYYQLYIDLLLLDAKIVINLLNNEVLQSFCTKYGI